MSHFLQLHLHLQRSVQGKLAFAHLHLEHWALQEHLTSSWHDLDTSGSVSQTGAQQPSSFFQPNLSGDGMFCWWSSLVAQIPAWYIDLFTCWRSASLKEEKIDNDEYYKREDLIKTQKHQILNGLLREFRKKENLQELDAYEKDHTKSRYCIWKMFAYIFVTFVGGSLSIALLCLQNSSFLASSTES